VIKSFTTSHVHTHSNLQQIRVLSKSKYRLRKLFSDEEGKASFYAEVQEQLSVFSITFNYQFSLESELL